MLAKARRRAALSVGLMLAGFMAIAGVIVYRLAGTESGPAARYALEAVALPAGAEVVGAQLEDGAVAVTYRVEGGMAIGLYDGRSGDLIRTITVTGP